MVQVYKGEISAREGWKLRSSDSAEYTIIEDIFHHLAESQDLELSRFDLHATLFYPIQNVRISQHAQMSKASRLCWIRPPLFQ